MNTYDMIIIGAGPSGATLARLVGKGYKVLLLDKRNLHQNDTYSHRKSCGGLLAPDAQKALATLGLGIPKDILVDPQLFAVRTMDLDTHLTRYYQRYYYNMDREAFDRYLVSLIPESVSCAFESLVTSVKEVLDAEFTQYEVHYTSHQKSFQATAPILIGESAGAISPSSAEGISYALKTAAYLADIMLTSPRSSWQHAYHRRLHRIRLNLMGKQLKSPVMYDPTLRHMAMASGCLTLSLEPKRTNPTFQ